MNLKQRFELQALADAGQEYGMLSHSGAWDLARAIPAILAQLARAEEVIRFYADKSEYHDEYVTLSCGCCSEHVNAKVMDDEGERARQYLQEIQS